MKSINQRRKAVRSPDFLKYRRDIELEGELAQEQLFTDDEIEDLKVFLSIWSPTPVDDAGTIARYTNGLSVSSLDRLVILLGKLQKSDTEGFISSNSSIAFSRNGKNAKQWIQWVINQIKIQRDRQEVLAHAESGITNSLRDKVAWILNNHKDTRNSDRLLALRFWEEFEPDHYNGGNITPVNFQQLTSFNSITRERARIQNQYELFQADDLIRRRRGTLQEEEQKRAVEDKPNIPVFVVYMDESGKAQENLIVGSVWILLNMRDIHLALYHIQEDKLGGKEFHFKNIRENSVHSYYEMVDTFIKYANTANFKALFVPRGGLRRREVEVIPDLFYHLLMKGIQYEFSTGRALPPRKLYVFIDSSESQMDAVMCENLEDRIQQASRSLFDGNLVDVQVKTLDSKSTIFLQIADLLASSINRLLTTRGTSQNEKDQFAAYFLSKVGIDINNLSGDQIGDTSILVSI